MRGIPNNWISLSPHFFYTHDFLKGFIPRWVMVFLMVCYENTFTKQLFLNHVVSISSRNMNNQNSWCAIAANCFIFSWIKPLDSCHFSIKPTLFLTTYNTCTSSTKLVFLGALCFPCKLLCNYGWAIARVAAKQNADVHSSAALKHMVSHLVTSVFHY